MYSSLLQHALDKFFFFDPRAKEPHQIPSSMAKPPAFKNLSSLQLILMLIPQAPGFARLEIFQDFQWFLIKSPENCLAVSRIPRWIQYLLQSLQDQPADESGNVTPLIDIVITIFAQVVWAVVQTEKKGWKLAEQFLVSMFLTKSPCRAAASLVLFDKLFDIALGSPEEVSPTIESCYSHFSLLLEEYMFFSLETGIDRPASPTGDSRPDFARDISASLLHVPIQVTQASTSRIAEGKREAALAEKVLRTLNKLGLLRVANFSQLEVKSTSSHLRNGGVLRIALALIFPALTSENPATCQWATNSLQTIVSQHINPSTPSFFPVGKEADVEQKKRVQCVMAALHEGIVGFVPPPPPPSPPFFLDFI